MGQRRLRIPKWPRASPVFADHRSLRRHSHGRAEEGDVERWYAGWQAQALLDLQEYYLQGNGGELNDDIQRVAGHRPRDIDAFLAANASAFSKRAATA